MSLSFKSIVSASAVVVASLGLCNSASAAASLIGDQINIRLAVPSQGNFDQTLSTIVAADSSDAVTFNVFGINIVADPFSNGITFHNASTIGMGVGPNSIMSMSGLDFTPTSAVSAVTLSSSGGWANTATTNTFTDSSATATFKPGPGFGQTWSMAANSSVTLTLDTVAVPEPASLGLLTAGSLLALRRRK